MRLGIGVPISGVGQPAAPESAYVGPLDIVPGAVVAYGQRALSAAKLGTALYTIRRDTDDTTQSFSSDAVTGDAPVASISSFIGAPFTHVGAVTDTMDTIVLASGYADVAVGQAISGADIPANTTVISIDTLPTIQISQAATGTNATETLTFTPNGFVSVWNDQSGNTFNALGSVPSTEFEDGQPGWVASAQGSKPALGGTSANGFSSLRYTGSSPEFTSMTVFCVTKALTPYTGPGQHYLFDANGDRDTANSYVNFYVEGAEATPDILFDVTDDGGTHEQGNNTTANAAYVGAAHVFEVIAATDVLQIKVDGVAQTLTSEYGDGVFGACNFVEFIIRICEDAASGLDQQYQECVVYNSVLSDANRLAIRQNIATYYGITLP